jgi:hypothetical protein
MSISEVCGRRVNHHVVWDPSRSGDLDVEEGTAHSASAHARIATRALERRAVRRVQDVCESTMGVSTMILE